MQAELLSAAFAHGMRTLVEKMFAECVVRLAPAITAIGYMSAVLKERGHARHPSFRAQLIRSGFMLWAVLGAPVVHFPHSRAIYCST